MLQAGQGPHEERDPRVAECCHPHLSPTSEIQQNAILSTWASSSVWAGSGPRPTSSQLPVTPRAAAVHNPPSHRAGRLQLKAPLLPWDVFYSVRSYCKSSSMGQRRIRPQGNVRSSPGSSFAFRLSSAAQCSDQEQLSSQPQSTLQMKAPLQAGKLRHSFKEE